MTEQEALAKMVGPGTHRLGKYGSATGFGGVVQVHVTRACDKACFNCTQGSNFGGRTTLMTPEQFGQAVESLRGYPGVVGVFGGNPAMHPAFPELCKILRGSWVPLERRGLWCNNPVTVDNAREAARTFNPAVSNLNVHLDRRAAEMFREGWPVAHVVGEHQDSRHAPVFVAMRDVLKKLCGRCRGSGTVRKVGETPLDPEYDESCPDCSASGRVYDESLAWELISGCDINQHWSAMIGVFRGELRAWFCEVAGAQAMLHQDDEEPCSIMARTGKDRCREDCAFCFGTGKVKVYPDTGINPTQIYCNAPPAEVMVDTPDVKWWQLGMWAFRNQVRKHCHDCGVPLRGRGELAQTKDDLGELIAGMERQPREQVSRTHAAIAKPKRHGRRVEVVERLEQLGVGRLGSVVRYLQNSSL